MLLWRIRKVFQGYSREYEIVVYDDASTDGTAEVLSPYAAVAPLTVIRGETRVGYGKALEILVREASRRTRYPRRDGMVLMQGDFTDQPEGLPELVKRFEGGADIVLATRGVGSEPAPVRRLRHLAPWALRFSIAMDGIPDPYASFRLFRISLLRDAIKALGDKPLLATDGWSANVELLMSTVPLARRVETVAVQSRYDLRVRQSRIRPFADAMALFRFGRSVKGRRIAVPAPAPQPAKPAPAGRASQRQQATS